MNYYNEFDPQAAAWLRELIQEGLIPDGKIDERSITEVTPSDLDGFTQCHFFAGIGGWSYALQLAGWPTDVAVWTGSCPCQPFSTAGKGKGKSDERHLWPSFYELIKERKPEHVFGEQVAGAIKHGWLDGVSDDLEKEGYACGAVVLPACSVESPHIRQRLFWVADSASVRQDQYLNNAREVSGTEKEGRMCESTRSCQFSRVADSNGERCKEQQVSVRQEQGEDIEVAGSSGNGWDEYDIVICKDKDNRGRRKARRVPRTPECLFRQLADGVSDSMDPGGPECGWPLTSEKIEGNKMLLAGYGNAIVPQVAAEFIKAYMGIDDSLKYLNK